MKIAVVTMNVKQGHCEENFAFMKNRIMAAQQAGVDMIVFPQNAVSGYLLGDRWLEDAWCQYVDRFNDRILALSDEIAIVWGNIRYRNQRRFNAAFFAYQGKTHMRVKRHGAYDYISDARYFEESDINSAIEFKGMVLALNFHFDIQLADLNINLDAYPYHMGDNEQVHGNVVYVNAVGVQNSGKSVMVMQGTSCVQYHQECVYQATPFEGSEAIVDLASVHSVKQQRPQVLDALLCGIREFDQQVLGGARPWIVGLSGGLDSSVSCALLACALGSDRIYGFNMATKHNRSTTICNAKHVADALQIHYKEGSIQDFVDASQRVFKDVFAFDDETSSTLVVENIQARARGYLLSGFAGILGGVVVNNGNKVESMLGYCTLYGDSVGALGIVGDLTKVHLFALAHQINERLHKEVIPSSLLPIVEDQKIVWEMPPSAELRDGQYDPMKWFYHDYLAQHLGVDMEVTSFMECYLHHAMPQELQKWITYYHLDEPKAFLADLDWFLTTMDTNAFKRLQTPPILCVHKTSLASQVDAQMHYDRKMYEALWQQIADM